MNNPESAVEDLPRKLGVLAIGMASGGVLLGGAGALLVSVYGDKSCLEAYKAAVESAFGVGIFFGLNIGGIVAMGGDILLHKLKCKKIANNIPVKKSEDVMLDEK